MKETTYEIDGVTYESVVTQSNTCRILANGGRGAMAMYGEIAKLRDGWIEQVGSSMPTGLCRQSWLSRFPDEVKADAGAMMNFIYDKYPKQAKRLFAERTNLRTLRLLGLSVSSICFRTNWKKTVTQNIRKCLISLKVKVCKNEKSKILGLCRSVLYGYFW